MVSGEKIEVAAILFRARVFGFFCRELRDGKPFENALKAAYPDSIQSIEELDKKWRKYVKSMKVPDEEEQVD